LWGCRNPERGTDVLGMENKYPAWVDLTAKDAVASRAFYAQLFGWRIQLLDAIDYGLVEPGPTTLLGGIGQQDAEHPAGIVTYFSVDDVEAALARAEGTRRQGRSTAVGDPRPRQDGDLPRPGRKPRRPLAGLGAGRQRRTNNAQTL
jgi:hypothetical protein